MAARFLGTRCSSGIRAAKTIGRLISLPSSPAHQVSKKLPLFPAGSVSAPNQKCAGVSFTRGIVSTRAAYDDSPPAAEEEEPKRKIFVGNLPWSVTVQELGDFFFDACGAVSDVYIPTDRNTGRPKGIGFVEFEDQASAAEAVANLGGTDLGGRALVVEFAGKPARAPRNDFRQDDGEPQPPTDRIFVSSLSYDTTWESLKDFFKAAGNVTYASVSERPDGSSKGCGVVQFETIEEAQGAIEMMNGADLDGRSINVREDRQRGGRDRRQPRQGSESWGRMQERGGRGGGFESRNEMRPGDWTCPSCGAHVFASKQNCFRCQEPKPAGAGASEGGGWDY